MDAYEGDVCYQDGWHRIVTDDGKVGAKLVLEDDGSYRSATDEDMSWHDLYHKAFVEMKLGG